jgi:hypothetical protein
MRCNTSSNKVILFSCLLVVLGCTTIYYLSEEIFLVGGLGSSFREGGKLRKDEDKDKQYYPNNEFWYVHPNGDRSGSIIRKMILVHSYAYYNNLTFRGLCHSNLNRIRQVNSCLDGLHLTSIFNASSCPNNYNNTSSSMKYNHPNIISPNKTINDDYITPNWLADINRQRQRQQLLSQQQQQQQQQSTTTTDTNTSSSSTQNNNNNNNNSTNSNLTTSIPTSTSNSLISKNSSSLVSTYRVAVHVRRGDVSPCTERYKYSRYLPNKYFLEILDQYINSNNNNNNNNNNINNNMNIDVTIYSESKTVEPFDGFIHRGYNLELDNDLAVVWKQLASADLLISSISNFNIVPALFSDGLVVLPPIGFTISKEVKNRFPHFISTNLMWSKKRINTIITKETDRLAGEFC